MIQTNVSPFELIPMEMSISTAIIKNALAPYELRNLAAKIVVLSVFPFFLLATFEALVVNSARLITNFAITLLDTAYFCWFSNSAQSSSLVPIVRAQAPVTPLKSSEVVEMPVPSAAVRDLIQELVTCLSQDISVIYGNKARLEAIKRDLEDTHPFQFLECIFGRFSQVRDLMPNVMNGMIVPGQFINGLATSMEKEQHFSKAELYLPSFAARVDEVSDANLRYFFNPTPNWKGLIQYLMKPIPRTLA